MKVSLADQMGAMAAIDEVRHRTMAIQEHLNLPARRKEVAKRIREYYASRGTQVDDAAIEEGVRTYFSNRLSFEAPKIGVISNALGNAYLNRAHWYAGIAVAVVAATLSLALNTALDAVAEKDAREKVIEFADARGRFAVEIARQSKLLIKQKEVLATMDLPSASRLVVAAENVVDSSAAKLALVPALVASDITADNSATSKSASYAGIQTLTSFYEDVRGNKERINLIVALVQKKAKLNEFSATNKPYAIHRMDELDTQAHSALNTADKIGIEAASTAVSALYSAYADLGGIKDLRSQLDGIAKQFARMGLNKDERLVVAGVVGRAKANLEVLDYHAAVRDVTELSRLLSYAMTPFKVMIVDRAGVKSGVERTYNNSGGKSWYLIAEAISPAGDNVPLKIVDAESGRTETVSTFGVRVTNAEYLKVRADKKQDGHIDVRQIGAKPSESITIDFDSLAQHRNPDMITEW